MPMYNSARYVAESIESVMAQTYTNWELLVVDDGSTDGSVDIVREYTARDERIHLLFNDNHTGMPSGPRNHGMKHATGECIAFLDSDDLWMKDKLALQVEMFKDKDTVAVFSDYEKIDEEGNAAGRIVHAPAYTTYSKLLYSNVIGNLTGMYDVRKVGKKFMLHIHHEDFAFWLSVLKEGGVARNVGRVTAQYREHSGSVSANKLKILKWHWDVLRDVEKLSLANAAWHYCFYAYKAFMKSRI